MLQKKPGLFKLLEIIIIILVSILVVVNIVFLERFCFNKHCTITNILTIILLVWATAFWFMVKKHSDKK